MNTVIMLLLPLAAVALLLLPLLSLYKRTITKKTAKRAVLCNLSMFFGICLIGIILPFGGFVNAASAADAVSSAQGMGYIAAALSTGLSAVGAGIAVAAAAPAAIGAFSEDAKNFGKSLIFVALGEGVALYGLLISILILNKI